MTESLDHNNKWHNTAGSAMTNLEEERELFQKRVEELKAVLQGFGVILPEEVTVKMAEKYDGMIPIERFMAESDDLFAPGALPDRHYIQDRQAEQAPGGGKRVARCRRFH